MTYLSSWLQTRNIFGYAIACSQMQKHVRSGLIYSKVKHLVSGLCWHFDTESKLDVLCQILGKNILVGIRVHPPKLGVPYNVIQNDSLNVIVGRTENGVPESFQNCGIDFKYHSPHLDIYVWSSLFAVGGVIDPPTENIRSQLVDVVAPGNTQSNLQLSDINLRVGLRFQMGASAYRIEVINNDAVLAKCVYGARKGTETLFDINGVTRAVLDRIKL